MLTPDVRAGLTAQDDEFTLGTAEVGKVRDFEGDGAGMMEKGLRRVSGVLRGSNN